MADEFDDYEVPRLNAAECAAIGLTLRTEFGAKEGAIPPIMSVLHLARTRIPQALNLELIARPDEAMGRALAYAKPNEKEIIARQSIVEGAILDTPLARHTLFHELVHVMFHPGPRKFRIAAGNNDVKFIANENSGEWQADQITHTAMMPEDMVLGASSASELALLARTPIEEARKRFMQVRTPTSGIVFGDLEIAIARLTGKPTAKLDLKIRLWNELPTIGTEPPRESRLCGSYRILWSEFNQPTECGWYIVQGRIRSHFDTMHQ